MKIIINKLKLLEETSKWKREFQKLNPINQNIIQLSPFRKSNNDLAAGVHKGTDNILNNLRTKRGLTIEENPKDIPYESEVGARTLQHKTRTNEFILNSGKDSKDITKDMFSTLKNGSEKDTLSSLNGSLGRRHEALEIDAMSRKPFENENSGQFYNSGIFGGRGLIKGNHNSATVLSNEAKLLNDLNYTSSAKQLRLDREQSNEHSILEKITGIPITDINNKNIRSVNKKIRDDESQGKYKYIHKVGFRQSISDLKPRINNMSDSEFMATIGALATGGSGLIYATS